MLNAIGDFWHPSWIERDPALRKKRIDHTLDCIDLADKLGAKTISTEPGGPLDGMDSEEGRKLLLEGLSAVEDSAREKGIRVLIEPEPELLIETSNQFKAFFKNLDSTIFGLNFDIGHFFCVGEDPVALVKEHKDVTYHFHLEDIAESRVHHHLIPGKGVIDLKGVLESIHEIAYDGFITVELYPYEDNPVDTAKTALEYLKGIGF
jgi:sugar phosphate isomerase/epimerase